MKSLDSLSTAMPVADKTRPSPFQHVLEGLSEFTGYISSQVYLPYHSPPGGVGLGNSYGLSPAEEQLKREIRSLKSLVLSRLSPPLFLILLFHSEMSIYRKSFMPTIPRPGVISRPTA